MKKVFALLLTVILSAVSLCGLVCNAAGSLATDKTVYTVGEEIKVTATGEGKDWVGLYLRDDVVGTPVSILWYYVEGNGHDRTSGETVVMQQANARNDEREQYYSIPAGEYKIVLCRDDGYEIIEQVDITVVEPAATTDNPNTSDTVFCAIVILTVASMVVVFLMMRKKYTR